MNWTEDDSMSPEQEREQEAREECARRGIDPDKICADGVTVWMVLDKERSNGWPLDEALIPAWMVVEQRHPMDEGMRRTQEIMSAPSPGRDERMARGRALYLAVYEGEGAKWEANEHKEIWCDKAELYYELLAISLPANTRAAQAVRDEAAPPPASNPDTAEGGRL